MKKIKNLIVGCGLSGAVIAERLASQLGEEVLIIDRRNHIGGNVFDYKDVETGITIHKYGPHVFHTNNQGVWNYLSNFTEWHRFMYRVKALIDGIEVNIPFNLDSLHKVFPESLANILEHKLVDKFGFNKKISVLELLKENDKSLEFLAHYVYEKVFLGYTMKQWGIKPEELDASVCNRVPIYISRDSRYFQDRYQAIPQNGYTSLIENILSNELIKIKLNTDFKLIRNEVECERLFYTGAIDEYFDYKLGRLPYRSLNLIYKKYDVEYFQSGPQINFPENYDYTRSVEYKHFLNEKSNKTVVSYELPCDFNGDNERFYPIPNSNNLNLYNKYLNEANKLSNVSFVGRLGEYKYYNMDQVIGKSLNYLS